MTTDIWIGLAVGLVPSAITILGFFMGHNSRIHVLETQIITLNQRIDQESNDRKELSKALTSLSNSISNLEGYLEKINTRKNRAHADA